MAPTVRKPLTLGFVGRGATSAKNAAALLSDLIEADSGKARIIIPATEAHWTESMEFVADFALENKFALVLVTDDTTADQKNLKGYVQQATEKIKVINPVNKVIKLTAEGDGKLIMLWDDEDDDCYNALELAEQESVEALDLAAGLHKLEFTGDSQEPDEAPEDEDGEPEADDLDDMDEAELQDAAEALGLDVEEYPEWEDVRVAIREIRAQGDLADEDNGEPQFPTDDEVLDWDFETLKKYAQDNGVEVPPRSKTTGYRNAVIEFLASARAHLDAVDQEEADLLNLPADDEAMPGAILDMTPVKEEIESLRSDIESVAKRIDAMSRAASEHMIELRTLVMEVTKPGTIQKAQAAAQAGQASQAAEKSGTKTTTTTRTVARKPAAAPQKAAGARKVNRPTAKPAPTDKEPERPLGPFMHLLGKKLTKAQAKEIVIAAAMRGRGRPTEDERTLITAAKEIVPQA